MATHRLPGSGIWAAAGAVADATPPDRDRVVDLLRGASLGIVVLGHILMAVVTWSPDGTPTVGNLLAELPALQPLTHFLQVMPIFFAAGAVANRVSWRSAQRRSHSWAQWMWGRLARLIRPVAYYLAAWIPLVLVLEAALGDAAAPLAALSTQLLWFLGVYVVVVATTPLQIRLARHGWWTVAVGVAAVAAVDLARFHVAGALGVINFVVVWVLAGAVGLIVRDRVDAPRMLTAVAGAAIAVNVAVIAVGPYPLSLVGMPGEKISNMAPPTLPLALHAVALICAVGAAWGPLTRWCARPRVWRAAVAAGGVAMTLYLWHLTALIALTVAEHVIGIERGAVGTAAFWAMTVAHTAVALAVVAVTVAGAAPLEHLQIGWLETRSARRAAPAWVGVAGVVAVAVGLLAFAATGMAGFPIAEVTTYAGVPLTPGAAFVCTAGGVLAVRAAAGPRPT